MWPHVQTNAISMFIIFIGLAVLTRLAWKSSLETCPATRSGCGDLITMISTLPPNRHESLQSGTCDERSKPTRKAGAMQDWTCDSCKSNFSHSIENTKLMIYLLDASSSHLVATCPSGHAARFFLRPSDTLDFLSQLPQFRASCRFGIEAPPWTKAAAAACWQRVEGRQKPQPSTVPELPELPQQLRRELYDDLRWFDRPN